MLRGVSRHGALCRSPSGIGGSPHADRMRADYIVVLSAASPGGPNLAEIGPKLAVSGPMSLSDRRLLLEGVVMLLILRLI